MSHIASTQSSYAAHASIPKLVSVDLGIEKEKLDELASLEIEKMRTVFDATEFIETSTEILDASALKAMKARLYCANFSVFNKTVCNVNEVASKYFCFKKYAYLVKVKKVAGKVLSYGDSNQFVVDYSNLSKFLGSYDEVVARIVKFYDELLCKQSDAVKSIGSRIDNLSKDDTDLIEQLTRYKEELERQVTNLKNKGKGIIKARKKLGNYILEVRRTLGEAEKKFLPKTAPYEAFRTGISSNLLQLMERESRVHKVALEALEGPKRVIDESKAEQQQLQLVIDELLSSYDNVTFSCSSKGFFVSINGGKRQNLNQLIAKANFEHLSIQDQQDDDTLEEREEKQLQFAQKLNAYALFQKTAVFKAVLDVGETYTSREQNDSLFLSIRERTGEIECLSKAEKNAINLYTGKFYRVLNSFLRGKMSEALQQFREEGGKASSDVNADLREILLHTVFIINALKKLPNYEDYGPSETSKYLWRGVSSYNSALIGSYTRLVETGEEGFTERGIMSCSHTRPSGSFFNDSSGAGLMVKCVHGKYINPWSQYYGQREVVLLPVTMIISHQLVSTTKSGKKIPIFLASPTGGLIRRSESKDFLCKLERSKEVHKPSVAIAQPEVPCGSGAGCGAGAGAAQATAGYVVPVAASSTTKPVAASSTTKPVVSYADALLTSKPAVLGGRDSRGGGSLSTASSPGTPSSRFSWRSSSTASSPSTPSSRFSRRSLSTASSRNEDNWSRW